MTGREKERFRFPTVWMYRGWSRTAQAECALFACRLMPARNMRRRWQTAVILAALVGLLASCATLQAPFPAPSFPQGELMRAGQDGVDIGVRPIKGEDEYLQWFDDNLPRIGVVALWVEIRNRRAHAIELRPANWILRVGDQNLRAMTTSEVFERYYHGHHIRMYSVGSDRSARLNMDPVVFHPGRLQPTLKREGLVFFGIDPEMASSWHSGATLFLRDILLDRHSKTTFAIAL